MQSLFSSNLAHGATDCCGSSFQVREETQGASSCCPASAQLNNPVKRKVSGMCAVGAALSETKATHSVMHQDRQPFRHSAITSPTKHFHLHFSRKYLEHKGQVNTRLLLLKSISSRFLESLVLRRQ